jgi:hypothetical protein
MDTYIPSPYIKQTVMRRIKMIWFGRRVLPLFILESMAIWFAAHKIAEYVFVNHVLQNAIIHTFSRSPLMIFNYFFHAFMNTENMVQMFILASFIGSALFAWQTFQTVRTLATNRGNFSGFSHVV